VVIGKYRVTTTTHDGKPMVTAVPESESRRAGRPRRVDGPHRRDRRLPGHQVWPYPFDSYGGIVVDDNRIHYALETQSRPAYGKGFFSGGPNPTVVAHELAHQWFGDSVALEKWQDIGSTRACHLRGVLWQEHEGTESIKDNFERTYAGFRLDPDAGDPGVAQLFGSAVYDRGGMTVYALRLKIGDAAFGKLLTTWTSRHRGGNADTDDLISVAEQISGRTSARSSRPGCTAEKPYLLISFGCFAR
jgi:hypothetical protein